MPLANRPSPAPSTPTPPAIFPQRAAKIYLKSAVAGLHPDEQDETRRGAPRGAVTAATR
jgi:hypothetical protein